MGIRKIVACAGALCLLLAGCGAPSPGAGGTGDWVTASTEELKEQGTALVNDMEQGDFAAVVGAFDDTMRSSLSEEKLAETWHTAVDAKGAFESITGASVNSAQGYGVTTVVAQHAGGSVAVQFTFSSDRKVGGLYLRDASADDIAAATATSDATGTPGAAAAPGATTAPEPTGPHSVDHPVAVGPHQLNGTLVTPEPDVQDRRIVVVLVSGSGPNDMDETVGANKPMRDIADGLAQAGISSLRYNKRYNQDPSADAGAWTLESEVLDDLDAALRMLPSSEAAGYSVVVAGHSLGGMLLPTILARHPEVAAGISLAGSPRDLFDIMTDQADAQIQSSDAGDDEKASARATQSAALAAAKALTDPNGEPILGMPASYIVSLNQMHARLPDDVAAIGVPVLVLQGGADAQVYPDKDYPAWRPVLDGKQADYRLFDGLNHLFMPVSGTSGPLDYNTPNHVDPQVVTAMADWLVDRLG